MFCSREITGHKIIRPGRDASRCSYSLPAYGLQFFLRTWCFFFFLIFSFFEVREEACFHVVILVELQLTGVCHYTNTCDPHGFTYGVVVVCHKKNAMDLPKRPTNVWNDGEIPRSDGPVSTFHKSPLYQVEECLISPTCEGLFSANRRNDKPNQRETADHTIGSRAAYRHTAYRVHLSVTCKTFHNHKPPNMQTASHT